MGLIEKILGMPYHCEWSSEHFVNPVSGRKFRFDGYFESLNLIVEFNGPQHRVYPNRYHVTDEDFHDLQWRDAEKARQVLASGTLHYLVVHDNEPWEDETYLRGRLRALGYLV
jgi:hypothetical protein